MYLVQFWLPIMVGTIKSKATFEGFIDEAIETPTGWRLDGTALPKVQVTSVRLMLNTKGKLLDVAKVIEKTYAEKKTRPLTKPVKCKISADLKTARDQRVEYINAAFKEIYGREMFEDETEMYLDPIVGLCEFGLALIRCGENKLAKTYITSIKEHGLKIELEILSYEPPAWLKKAVSASRNRRKSK